MAWEDRWILSRLSFCAQKTNESLEKYEFANATTATYSFFLYELCDVYLELLKPRFYGESSDEQILKDRDVARHILYVCLDWSMRLMYLGFSFQWWFAEWGKNMSLPAQGNKV